ncbi:MAG: hypothetical protein AAB706_02235 [Patescibacteria group bacterium]
MDLRKQFVDNLIKLAENDNTIILLTGDLGFNFLERFAEKFPDKYINCGIAEENMVGVAAGLALACKKPYVYSNAIFLLSRAHEFVKNDVAYNNLNVKLIGTGAAGFLGFSHNIGDEESEKNWLKGMPNIQQFYPQNENELAEAMEKSYKDNSPAYVRI